MRRLVLAAQSQEFVAGSEGIRQLHLCGGRALLIAAADDEAAADGIEVFREQGFLEESSAVKRRPLECLGST